MQHVAHRRLCGVFPRDERPIDERAAGFPMGDVSFAL
jgi:hypothetical protein